MTNDLPYEAPEAPAEAGRYFSENEGARFSSNEVPDEGKTIQLQEERLTAHKEMRHVGDVEIRTEVEEVPGRIEVEAVREEVEVEHVPIGRVVSEREAPRHEGDTLIVPVYEEQLVVTKRLVLKEELHVRRIQETEMRLFEDTLRRERLVIEDSDNAGLFKERYPRDEQEAHQHEGFLENLKRKVMTP